MAVVTLSPLASDLRKKVGTIVFSKWRGINYIRALVTPANPNTQAQIDVRNSLARCVDFYQTFVIQTKTAWNYVATGKQYSGYNRFVSENRAPEQALAVLQCSPVTNVNPMMSFVPTTGTITKEIDVAFTPDPVPPLHTMEVICRVTPMVTEKIVFGEQFSIVAGQISPQTLTMALAATSYRLHGMLAETLSAMTGRSIGSTATSQT